MYVYDKLECLPTFLPADITMLTFCNLIGAATFFWYAVEWHLTSQV